MMLTFYPLDFVRFRLAPCGPHYHSVDRIKLSLN